MRDCKKYLSAPYPDRLMKVKDVDDCPGSIVSISLTCIRKGSTVTQSDSVMQLVSEFKMYSFFCLNTIINTSDTYFK